VPYKPGRPIQVFLGATPAPKPVVKPAEPIKAKQKVIGLLLERHFDETELKYFSAELPKHGYQVEVISRLWNQEFITFAGNDNGDLVRVYKDVQAVKDHVDPIHDVAHDEKYAGFIALGGYAMDRLRYEDEKDNPHKGKPNSCPAVNLIRTLNQKKYPLGFICHSLWIMSVDPSLLKGRKVTCAPNVVYDITNAGADIQFDAEGARPLVVNRWEILRFSGILSTSSYISIAVIESCDQPQILVEQFPNESHLFGITCISAHFEDAQKIFATCSANFPPN